MSDAPTARELADDLIDWLVSRSTLHRVWIEERFDDYGDEIEMDPAELRWAVETDWYEITQRFQKALDAKPARKKRRARGPA